MRIKIRCLNGVLESRTFTNKEDKDKSRIFIAMDLRTPPGKIFKEKLGSNQLKADCTLTLSQTDLLSLVRNYVISHNTDTDISN